MYSMDDLLHLVNSDGTAQLRLHFAPVLVRSGEPRKFGGLVITYEDAEHLLQSIANTRQRRELRARGRVQFGYQFRNITDFLVFCLDGG